MTETPANKTFQQDPFRQSFFSARTGIRHAIDVLVIILAAFLLRPFIGYLFGMDGDALAMIGAIRVDHEFVGWPGGFYLISMLVGLVNAPLNWLTRFNDHYQLAYWLVEFLCLLGLIALVYGTIVKLTGRRSIAALWSLTLLLLPGILYLYAHAEDNLVASFFHFQYIVVFWALVCRLGKASPGRPVHREWLIWLLPVSLFLAVNAHRALNVVWITPLALFFFLRPLAWRSIFKVVAITYGVAIAGFLILFAILSWYWTGGWSLEGWLGAMEDWLFPNAYYQQFYFFNEFGWDLPRQAGEIATGLRTLISEQPLGGRRLRFVWVLLGVLLLAPYVAWQVKPERPWLIPALFIVIHLPHSLVYESANIERWDVILPPLVVLAALMSDRLDRQFARQVGRFRFGYFWPIAVLLVLIGTRNFQYHQELLDWLERENQRDFIVAFQHLGEDKVLDPEHGGTKDEDLSVVLREEYFVPYWEHVVPFFEYDEEIYTINEELVVKRPLGVYPVMGLEPLSTEELETWDHGPLIMTPEAGERYERLVYGPECP